MSETAVLDIPVIDIVHPLPGFPEARRFALVQLDDAGVLCALRSLDDPDLRFLVVPPQHFFPDYTPEVSDDVVAELGIDSEHEVLLLVILTAGATLTDTTANLLAPVVVNTRTREAAQVILDDATFPVAAPLLG
ncbi:flagellar assembly protein FliW [Nocardioides sp.]|uniref:flagellar assembly protein FliW n=1 Tax=Nocardioides sp. TaxID=35761 RepID=UPI00351507AC